MLGSPPAVGDLSWAMAFNTVARPGVIWLDIRRFQMRAVFGNDAPEQAKAQQRGSENGQF